MNENPLIEKYIPFIVNYVTKKTGIPKTNTELMEFCKELGKLVIKKTMDIKIN